MGWDGVQRIFAYETHVQCAFLLLLLLCRLFACLAQNKLPSHFTVVKTATTIALFDVQLVWLSSASVRLIRWCMEARSCVCVCMNMCKHNQAHRLNSH